MTDVAAVDEVPAPDAPAESSPASLFNFSIWVHVGPGAEECSEVDESTGENRCGDPGHFHAWCRLPNQFQEREIREHADAARARKLRQLRKDGTDANVILESELEELLAEPDALERMANEMIGYDWSTDYIAAVREARDLESESPDAEEGTKLYEHVDEDRIQYARLLAEDPETRNEDEFSELKDHLTAYEAKVKENYEAITNPKRESYLTFSEMNLAELLRQRRIKLAGQQEFMHYYSIHEWLSCTYRKPDGEHRFADMDALQAAPKTVLGELQEIFGDLERTAQEAQGN